jgi:CheY-like chemotaxis protein
MLGQLTAYFENKSILVVDDDNVSALLLREYLAHLKAKVLIAHSICEALRLINQTSNIALALLDIRLGDGCGFDLAQIIKKVNSNIIVIAQTALPLDDDERKNDKCLCNSCLQKPIIQRQLFETILAQVNLQEQLSA